MDFSNGQMPLLRMEHAVILLLLYVRNDSSEESKILLGGQLAKQMAGFL